MAHWIDNADSYICSACGYECNNPNKEKYGAGVCSKCGARMDKEEQQMKKITLEFTEPELKVIASALKYTKAYKGVEVYEAVLKKIVDQLSDGVPKYYVVQGILDDSICRCNKAVLVKAKSQKHAEHIAKAYLETDTGDTFTPTAVGEATKDYGLCEVL